MSDDRSVHALETLAVRHGVVPLPQITLTDPTALSQRTDRLVRGPSSCHPWLPVGTLGPLLIMGHYNPACTDFMGVPDPFCVKAVIHTQAYEERRGEFFSLWTPAQGKPEGSRRTGMATGPIAPLSPNSTKGEALAWFSQNYPFASGERRAFQAKLQSLSQGDGIDNESLDGLIPQLGLALEILITGRLAFDPASAPPLDRDDPDTTALLERHSAYPLLDSPRCCYWLCDQDVDLEALERAWRSDDSTEGAEKSVFRVWADRNAILKRLQRESLRSGDR